MGAHWSATESEKLEALVLEGNSFRQIGDELGRNRNSCISRARILGLKHPGAKRAHVKSTGQASLASDQIQPTYSNQRKPFQVENAPENALMLTMGGLEAGQCKWPFDAPEGEPVLFCGADVTEHQDRHNSYCPHHHKISLRPIARRSV